MSWGFWLRLFFNPSSQGFFMSADTLFAEFDHIVRRLRKECPWDREQTHQSLRPALLEETYEALEAIESKDMAGLKGELGDLLLHVLLQSVIAEEEHSFSLEDVIKGITEKMIRRHPHVFAAHEVVDAETVRVNWERIKMGEGRTSVLEGIPIELPALIRALRLQDRAAKVGFDWEKKEDVWKKVEEELGELHQAETTASVHHIEEEFGDVLFALVNYARFLKINPEFALRRTCEKFTHRFRYVEERLSQQGKTPGEVTLKEMDQLWEEKKLLEQKEGDK
jgi:MazG family protein